MDFFDEQVFFDYDKARNSARIAYRQEISRIARMCFLSIKNEIHYYDEGEVKELVKKYLIYNSYEIDMIKTLSIYGCVILDISVDIEMLFKLHTGLSNQC